MSENIKIKLEDLLIQISPLQRLINSEGLNETFKIIKEKYPEIIIHNFNSGEKVEDWEVPKAWKVIKGQILDSKKNIISSIDENILLVAPYSESVKGWFTKNEIEKHLRTRKDKPDDYLLEHRNAYDYNLKTWGITLPFNIWNNLKEEKYFVDIEVEWKENPMKVGEIFIKGETDKVVSFTAHIDELCNDDLSGCVVGLEYFNMLKDRSNLKYSYQLLLLPELFGPIYFLNKFKKDIKKCIGMINLETIGAGQNLCLKKSLNSEFYLENLMKLTLSDLKKKYKELNFFEGYLNDEKLFSWPSFNIDSIALQRYPFSEYHTSSDNINIIDYNYLLEILDILNMFTTILEQDYIPSYLNKFPPWLTKRNLYFDKENKPDLEKNKFNNHLLYSIDGKKKLSEICNEHELNFNDVNNYLSSFLEQKILLKQKI